MDALPYVDTLFKEYLLFRGFSHTLQAFNKDLTQDRGCGFQAAKIVELVFRLIKSSECTELVEFLDFLNIRLYSRLDSRYEPLVRSVETSLLRHALVTALRAGRKDRVAEFFKEYGSALLGGPEAGEWRAWFALAYLEAPEKDPAFQVYFSAEWAALLEVSFSNFIGEVLRCLPLPAVLRFNADRLARRSLQQRVDALSEEVDRLRAALAAKESATAAQQQKQQQQRQQQQQQQQPGSQHTGQQPSAPSHTSAQQQQQQQHGDGELKGASAADTGRRHSGSSQQEALNPAAAVAAIASHRREASLVDWHAPVGASAAVARTGSGLRGSSSSGSWLFGLLPESHGAQPGGHGLPTAAPGPAEGTGAMTLAAVPSAQQPQQPPSLPGQQPMGLGGGVHSRPLTRQASSDSFISAATSVTDDDACLQDEQEGSVAADDPALPRVYGRSSSSSAVQGRSLHQGSAADAAGVQPLPGQQRSSVLPIPPRTSRPHGSSSGSSSAAAQLSASWDASFAARASRDSSLEAATAAGTPRSPGASSGSRSGRRSSNSSPLPWERLSSSFHTASHPASARLGPSPSRADVAVTGAQSATTSARRRPPAPPVGTKFHVARQSTEQVASAPPACAAFSPTGACVASACEDGSVAIWSVQGLAGEVQRHASFGVGGPVKALAWDARADKVMVIGTAGRGIKAWHADTRRMVADMPADAAYPDVTAVACCPTDPSFVCATAGGGRGRLALWNMRAFKRTQVVSTPNDAVVTAVCYSPNGTLIAAATEHGDIHVFDASRPQAPLRSWVAVAQPPASGSSSGGSGAGSSSSGGTDTGAVNSSTVKEVQHNDSVSSSSSSRAATTQVAFRSKEGGTDFECTLLSLRHGMLQHWSIASRTPLFTLDVAAAAQKAAIGHSHGAPGAASSPARDTTEAPASSGSGSSSAVEAHAATTAASAAGVIDTTGVLGDRAHDRPSSCCFAAAADGERVAVACGGSSSGCVLLCDVRLGGDQEGQLLLASELLAGDVVLDCHPSDDVLVVGGKGLAVLSLHLAAN